MSEGHVRNGLASRKRKLCVDEQIAHLKAKGVRFEKCSEDEARAYLSTKCNFFKVASYRKLFAKHQGGKNDGKYIALDFAQLKLLCSLDQQLREVLLAMTLDLEHFQKVSLLHRLENRSDEDGYSIVDDYFDALGSIGREHRVKEIERSGFSPYSKELYEKRYGDMAAWVFLELTSFGTLLDFMLFCGKRWDDRELVDAHYDFKRVKSIRNSAAHGTCLINSFASGVTMNRAASERVMRAVSSSGFSKATRKKRMRNPAVREVATTLVLFDWLVPEGNARSRALTKLRSFFGEVESARGLLPEEGPDSTAMATLGFVRGLTRSLELLK